MKVCTLVFCLFCIVFQAQTIKDCKYRFDNYLNFKGSLNRVVKFENNVLYIEDKGKKEFAVYANELKVISNYFQNTSQEEQEAFVRFKKIKKLKLRQLDSLEKLVKKPQRKIVQTKEFPLKGYRIAIDPGHF